MQQDGRGGCAVMNPEAGLPDGDRDGLGAEMQKNERDSKAAVAGQASPSVSTIAAASASRGDLPPHRTNWNTG